MGVPMPCKSQDAIYLLPSVTTDCEQSNLPRWALGLENRMGSSKEWQQGEPMKGGIRMVSSPSLWSWGQSLLPHTIPSHRTIIPNTKPWLSIACQEFGGFQILTLTAPGFYVPHPVPQSIPYVASSHASSLCRRPSLGLHLFPGPHFVPVARSLMAQLF